MRIGDLAARTGASVRSLRYYEEQGLLTSVRSASGQRHYTEEHVKRVEFIRRLLAGGLSSRTIAEVLPCIESPSAANTDAALERLAQERERLAAHIDDLRQTLDTLDMLMAVARDYRRHQEDGDEPIDGSACEHIDAPTRRRGKAASPVPR